MAKQMRHEYTNGASQSAPNRPLQALARPPRKRIWPSSSEVQGPSQILKSSDLARIKRGSELRRRARDGAAGDGDEVDAVAVAAAVGQIVAKVRARGTHSLAVAEHAPAASKRRR